MVMVRVKDYASITSRANNLSFVKRYFITCSTTYFRYCEYFPRNYFWFSVLVVNIKFENHASVPRHNSYWGTPVT